MSAKLCGAVRKGHGYYCLRDQGHPGEHNSGEARWTEGLPVGTPIDPIEFDESTMDRPAWLDMVCMEATEFSLGRVTSRSILIHGVPDEHQYVRDIGTAMNRKRYPGCQFVEGWRVGAAIRFLLDIGGQLP